MQIKKTITKMHVKRGEIIQVISGRDKGKIGKIIKVLAKSNKIIVENLNIATKHLKAQKDNNGGSIIRIEKPINSSNVVLYKQR
uniref:Large ribosomal subunit protein uL24c n=1 Tax=Gracilaria firma TaxID=2510791 RepID=A0A1P8D6B5_9FLOR|nr:50S ribosomal protein L24 [Gracilaria firma]YP_009498004.1 ribosomal protein L24 [Gracilaria changii]APR74345.1 50S ribosomal protein L24 [Gracilaria firma]ART65267.1 ribosomal protein L24 [Gracilaria changii]